MIDVTNKNRLKTPYTVRESEVCSIGYKIRESDRDVGDFDRLAKTITVGLKTDGRYTCDQ